MLSQPKHSYEGLIRDGAACHLKGILTFSNGDRYQGEFNNNQMQGYGAYIWKQQEDKCIYRGQWHNSTITGCGVKLTKQLNGSFITEEGRFDDDEWMGEDVKGCSVEQARKAASRADAASAEALAFVLPADYRRRRHKKDGVKPLIFTPTRINMHVDNSSNNSDDDEDKAQLNLWEKLGGLLPLTPKTGE